VALSADRNGEYDAKKAWLGKLKPTYILVPECPLLTMRSMVVRDVVAAR